MRPPSNGRRKIQMKQIENRNSLLVSFCKRKSGVIKKASELCTLCGVQLAIIVFTPTGKVASFGNPSVQEIVDRFQSQDPPATSSTSEVVQHYRNMKTQQLNMKLTNLLSQLEAEKKTSEELDQMTKAKQKIFWWYAPLENLGVEELEKLKLIMLELKTNSEKQAEKLTAEVTDTLLNLRA